MRLRTLGIEPNGLRAVSNRLVEFAFLVIDLGLRRIWLSTLRSEPNDLGVVCNRFVELALRVIDLGFAPNMPGQIAD